MSNQTTFLNAIKSGDEQVARVLLAENPNLVYSPTEMNISVILMAAYFGYTDLANHFANQKPDLDIFEASATNHQTAIQKMLLLEPDLLQSYATDGFTPLGLASFFGHYELVDFFLKKGADPNQVANNLMKVSPLHSAVARRRTAIVKLLLEAGAEVSAKQSSGVTPLHSAAHNGDMDTMQVLLQYGPDQKLETEEGKTPLHLAKEEGFTNIVELLD